MTRSSHRGGVVHKVLVTDYTWADTKIEEAVLADVGAELVKAETGDEGELVELVRDCAGLLTCFKQVTDAVIRAGERLKVVGRYGIGTDNIAVATATELKIPVTNVPEYCSDEVAEHVIALLFGLVRGIPRYDAAVRAGNWSLATGLPTRRIAGMTLGIVGAGAIGQAVEKRALGLGMGVLIHARRSGIPLLELAARSDVVSVHIPANSETAGLIDATFLAAMKPTAYLINCARGAVIDQPALVEALRDGGIAGAGLDVFAPEPLPVEHPLLALDNVIATPHTAFYSEESVANLARLASENVAAVLAGMRPTSIVNPEIYVEAG